MKKFLKSLTFAFVSIMALNSCEDVPSPYIVPEKPSAGNGIGYTSASLNSGWTSAAVNGLDNPWSQGSSYTQATGSQKWDGTNRSNKEVEGYLFSPSLNTTSENGKVFTTFDYCVGYTSGATGDPDYKEHIKMYVSKTYEDGDEFVKEQWEEMPFVATFTSTDWTLTTVSVAVPEAYVNQENVHFAYWFYAPATKSCTFELKNFKLANKEHVENGEGGGDITTNNGSKENPLTVSQAKTASGNSYVKGYIVGYVDGTKLENAVFSLPSQQETEILIAESATETSVENCMPIQLPIGDIRNGLDLFANPTNLGKEVLLYGSCETYFGTLGMKSTSWAKIGDKEIGKDPEGATGNKGEAKGTGTLADPFNPTAANAYTAALNKDAESTEDIYIKGKICSIKEAPTAQYGNATFYISEDGSADADQFYCFRVLNLGNQKFTGSENLKVGDEVIICGKVVNYKGNTPETVQNKAYIYSLNGNTEGGGDKGDGDKGDDEKVSQSKDDTTLTFTLKDGEVGSNSGMIDLGAYGVAQRLKDGTTVESVTLSDGGTITFSAGTNTNAPKYYSKTKGLRIYGNNVVTIEGKAEIAKVDITCDGADYMGNDGITVAVSGNTWTITNSGSGTTQLRAQTITVTYVK